MSGYTLSRRAAADLGEIWDYSAEHWGRDRANRYLGDPRHAMDRLAADPLRGRAVKVRAAEYLRHRSGSHLIYYRRTLRGIHVVRVLHQSMDQLRHLP